MSAAIDLQHLVSAGQTLKTVAPVSHIETDADYERATSLLNGLLDTVRDDKEHLLYPLVSVIGDLIEAYERDREPLDN